MADLAEIVKSDYDIENNKYIFDYTPVWKVVYLSLITFGFYEMVMFYKYWKTLRDEFGYKVSPVWRAIFAPITGFWLFSILAKYIKAHDIPAFPPVAFAIGYFILSNTYKIPDPYWLICFCTVVFIAVAQDKINKVNEKFYPEAPQNTWTLTNTLWAIPFTLIFILSVIGTFLPD